MALRIRRNRPEPKSVGRVEELMKSISTLQVQQVTGALKLSGLIDDLYREMKAVGVKEHRMDSYIAQVFQPRGRASNVVDPVKYRKLVKNDKDFFSSIKVSMTEAKKVLPAKQLAAITTTKDGVLGPETAQVVYVGR